MMSKYLVCMMDQEKHLAEKNLSNEADSRKHNLYKETKNRTESLPNSTSKHVFPQAQEMVFIRGQGEQTPLPNNRYVKEEP